MLVQVVPFRCQRPTPGATWASPKTQTSVGLMTRQPETMPAGKAFTSCHCPLASRSAPAAAALLPRDEVPEKAQTLSGALAPAHPMPVLPTAGGKLALAQVLPFQCSANGTPSEGLPGTAPVPRAQMLAAEGAVSVVRNADFVLVTTCQAAAEDAPAVAAAADPVSAGAGPASPAASAASTASRTPVPRIRTALPPQPRSIASRRDSRLARWAEPTVAWQPWRRRRMR